MLIKHGKNWFTVSIIDGLKIYGIKILLKMRRLWRWKDIFVRANKITLLLFPTWLLYLLIVIIWNKSTGYAPSLMEVLWQCKEGFFTSVITVMVMNTAQVVRDHKKSLWYRWMCWMNLMDIINGLMTYLYGKTTGKNGPYSVLLSRERFSVFEKEIQGKIVCDESIHVRLAELREQCMKIRQDRRYTVLCSTEDASFDHINACMNRIIELSDKEVIECISLLFDLTYSLGYIWNVDIDMRVKIDKILHENYSCSSYDNRCLYEIYCCSDISKYPYSRMQ